MVQGRLYLRPGRAGTDARAHQPTIDHREAEKRNLVDVAAEIARRGRVISYEANS